MNKTQTEGAIVEDTASIVLYTDISDSKKAGEFLGFEIQKAFQDNSPDVVIVFASSQHTYSELLQAIKTTSKPKLLLGCSSAGEFITQTKGEGSVSAIAIRNESMEFRVGFGSDIHNDPLESARSVIESFKGIQDHRYAYRSALVLADALAGHTDALIDELTQLTAGTYQFFGGGAGDDAKFSKTHVFYDTKAETNAVVALEILSHKPIGIGVRHGWKESSEEMRVTASDGMRLISLNAKPAIEVFQAHATSTNQILDVLNPVPFFLHNVIGIKTVNGYKLRVPLTINEDGSIECASDVPTGAIVTIMQTTSESAAVAAKEAAEDAVRQLKGEPSNVAIVFDCVATRLRTGKEFDKELNAVADTLGGINYAGCNTYGQIARVDGQFNGFHNCTAVVCVLPK